MKTAANLVVHPTVGHLACGVLDNLLRLAGAGAMKSVQQKFKRHCRRKLRRTTETSVDAIIVGRDAAVRGVKKLAREHVSRRLRQPDASEFAQHRGRSAGNLF